MLCAYAYGVCVPTRRVPTRQCVSWGHTHYLAVSTYALVVACSASNCATRLARYATWLRSSLYETVRFVACCTSSSFFIWLSIEVMDCDTVVLLVVVPYRW